MNQTLLYLFSACLFILSIRSLSTPATARRGNLLGIIGMAVATCSALAFLPASAAYFSIITALLLGGIIGLTAALKVKMTALPQLVAAFNGSGGLAAFCTAFAELSQNQSSTVWSVSGMIIGGITFSGSVVAFGKLQGLLAPEPRFFPLQHAINLLLAAMLAAACFAFVGTGNSWFFHAAAILALLLGVLLLLPIGGADMPIIISVLNSYSGWAAAGIGFSLGNILLIITGTIVGAGGAILSYVMTQSMNSSLLGVMLGGFARKRPSTAPDTRKEEKHVNSGSPKDAAFIMENSSLIIIVPGYGMAAARAQHAVKELADVLRKKYNVSIKFAIHPVAGRMPGHMNVLLAEADVAYDDIFELKDINREFSEADVAYVIGANDITNPAAIHNPDSPLYGMPVFDVGAAKTVFFVKRTLAGGYSGADNPLFYAPNTVMLFGNAKKVTEEIVQELEA